MGRVAACCPSCSFANNDDPNEASHFGCDDQLWRLGLDQSASGYKYRREDPLSKLAWPAIPGLVRDIAQRAAAEAGFGVFAPDSCLVNRYRPGDKLGLHRDVDEQDLTHPIVSFSLGLPAIFVVGGFNRSDPLQEFLLQDGDVLVFGGPARLRFHGVLPIKQGIPPLLGATRINLTCRVAGETCN